MKIHRLSTISAYNNNGVEVYGNWLLDTTAAYVVVVEASINQEKALVGAFSVTTNLRVDLGFQLYY